MFYVKDYVILRILRIFSKYFCYFYTKQKVINQKKKQQLYSRDLSKITRFFKILNEIIIFKRIVMTTLSGSLVFVASFQNGLNFHCCHLIAKVKTKGKHVLPLAENRHALMGTLCLCYLQQIIA